MLRSTLFAVLVASSAFAQNASFVPDLASTLTANGLTRLVSLIQNISNTEVGKALLADLPNGNKTIFAPIDKAFNGKPPSNITDPNVLAAILSYHVVSGTFTANQFASAPNHTIVRTFLSDPSLVKLEANRSQVVSLSNVNGTVQVLGQNTFVQVINSTTFQNIPVHIVNAVLDPPPKLSDAINSHNLSVLTTAATQAGLLSSLEGARGITIFAPNDAAFNAALQALGGAANVNASTLSSVLANHVINGTTVYAAELGSATFTSAGGQPFSFASNSSGTFVTSGNSTAKVLETDVLTENGVVHVIDGVLLNTQSNPEAASSAFQSATSAAAASPTQTGPIGPTGSGSSSGNGNGNGNGSGSSNGNGTNGNNNNGGAIAIGAAIPFRALAVSVVLSAFGFIITL